MTSDAVVSTLQHVTDRKLSNLSTQAARFAKQRRDLLDQAASHSNKTGAICALVNGIKDYGIQIPPGAIDPDLETIDKFLNQSLNDPSVSPELLESWQTALEKGLDIINRRYRYAMLFGELLTEWIQNPNPHTVNEAAEKAEAGTPQRMETDFEPVGRTEMHEQRKQWEEYALNEHVTDQNAIRNYLDRVFEPTKGATKFTSTAFETLRREISGFTKNNYLQFDSAAVKNCIQGLLNADLYAGKRRQALADLKNKPEVLSEMADVLNQDLESLESWEWATNPVPLSMRRQLNGHYRVYMDEEYHQAILLSFVGMKWATYLKSRFISFLSTESARNPFNPQPKEHVRLWNRQIGPNSNIDSIRCIRQKDFMKDYFISQLPSTESEATAESPYDEGSRRKRSREKPAHGKQSILRLVTTEALLNINVHGEFVAIQSDFKWFGPSLSHSTIFAVLQYLGVEQKWLDFFQKFLRPNVAFSQDGSNVDPMKRKRGIPMSHVLSTAIGEAVLFCLDYAVYKATMGGVLYRFHDDLWFWGLEDSCKAAWSAIEEFTSVMGLDLNMEKTGTCRLLSAKASPPGLLEGLPRGDIKWGFLKMCSNNDAQNEECLWSVDMAQVDQHIRELKRQLDECRSVFAWVRVWNSYVNNFFSNNFGHPAVCLGHQHVKMCIDTFTYVQRELFKDVKTGANVTEYLRKTIEERFSQNKALHIPDGFFYFGTDMGGLGLRNPFIPLFIVLNNFTKKPYEYFELAAENDEKSYINSAEAWAAQNVGSPFAEDFMSWEEYSRYTIEDSLNYPPEYKNLLEDPKRSCFDDVEYQYQRWTEDLYGQEISKKFGGMELSEHTLLPKGLLSMMKDERVRWQG